MGLAYRAMYRIGLTPWDHDEVPGWLTAVAEGEDALPPGRALDLGCGSGRDAVYLARRGWQVTGVDAVSLALSRAAERARQAAVTVRWVPGDVS